VEHQAPQSAATGYVTIVLVNPVTRFALVIALSNVGLQGNHHKGYTPEPRLETNLKGPTGVPEFLWSVANQKSVDRNKIIFA